MAKVQLTSLWEYRRVQPRFRDVSFSRNSWFVLKIFPFSHHGLTCSHAVIRYRQPGQLDGSRERSEYVQERTGQPFRFQRDQAEIVLEKDEIKLSADIAGRLW